MASVVPGETSKRVTTIKFTSGGKQTIIKDVKVSKNNEEVHTRSSCGTPEKKNVVQPEKDKQNDKKDIVESPKNVAAQESKVNNDSSGQTLKFAHDALDVHTNTSKTVHDPCPKQDSRDSQFDKGSSKIGAFMTDKTNLSDTTLVKVKDEKDTTDVKPNKTVQPPPTTDGHVKSIAALNEVLLAEEAKNEEAPKETKEAQQKSTQNSPRENQKDIDERKTQTLPAKKDLKKDIDEKSKTLSGKSDSLPRANLNKKQKDQNLRILDETKSLSSPSLPSSAVEKAKSSPSKNVVTPNKNVDPPTKILDKKQKELKLDNQEKRKGVSSSPLPQSQNEISTKPLPSKNVVTPSKNVVALPNKNADKMPLVSDETIPNDRKRISFPLSDKDLEENEVRYRKDKKAGDSVPTSPTISRIGSVVHTANTTRAVIQAILVRCLLFAHSLLCVWRTADVYKENLYWLLALSNVILLLETIVSVIRRKGQETKWICACFFLYLCGTVPSIWFLEIDKLDRYNEAVDSSNISSVAEGLSTIQGVSIPIKLDPDTWISVLEQSLLFILVIGRLLLPRGNISRDHLSQMLFVFIGSGSDVMELFVVFEEPTFREDNILRLATLIIWTVSLLQFTLVLPTAKSPKKIRLGTEFAEDDNFFGLELWSMVISITLMDGPYLGLRLYAIIEYGVLSYGIIFFTCKNIMMLVLLIYRFFIICIKMRSRKKRLSKRLSNNP